MPLTVRLFASLRARYGETTEVNLDPPLSALELRSHLQKTEVWTPGARVAVNHEFVGDDATISPGDEVAVVPPVSGG
ncbi:MAG: MoaD/ThiS family protein [Armatimonadetes bacterium]|nr:MAG: MoaD/ThiS family protein [Armatimonadota bacterium]MCE7898767.1 MoaD/ThiS family protein [Armatimonadetes bacterium ATM1]MDL1928736.1 MoaD/ThiS family protein [Fimbriimonadia bacterium ATM]MBC6968395.1 MoaD/ThiS family protein [Armatimonadota bacterium]MBL1150102.1 MoaD/ThiS family protein [Armatimonadota bacterium]